LPLKRWWLKVDFDDDVKRLPKGHLRVLVYSLVLAIGYADHVLGYQFGFSIFYLLPIIIATRNLGKNTGLFISVMCAALWAYMDSIHGVSYPSPLVMYWNTFIRFVLFIITVMIFDGWEKEKETARRDTLTQVANRLAFNEFGEMEIRRCRRYQHAFSLIYIDVDNFKTINDRFGHRAGDRLLVLLAEALRANFRETDLVARLGGDEFSIILVETEADGAEQALKRVCDVLEKIPRMGSIVTLSIGLLTFTHPPESFEEAVKKADELMYLAKNKGKNFIQRAVIDGKSEVRSEMEKEE
jgi:diguanylate cyclase (GGDEF)-like protein